MKVLNGYKTYIVGFLGVLWSIFGLAMGWIEGPTATQVILFSLGIMGIRSGVKEHFKELK